MCAAGPAPGPWPAGEEKARQGPAPGRSMGACHPAGGSAPRQDLQKSVVPAVGVGTLGGPGSVGDLGVRGQAALATPVGLPEALVQLLQLRAQRQVAGQVHAEGLQPLLQLPEGGPGGGRRGWGGFWVLPWRGQPPP